MIHEKQTKNNRRHQLTTSTIFYFSHFTTPKKYEQKRLVEMRLWHWNIRLFARAHCVRTFYDINMTRVSSWEELRIYKRVDFFDIHMTLTSDNNHNIKKTSTNYNYNFLRWHLWLLIFFPGFSFLSEAWI